jgi:photosystem II stability/assembly factor-like uncharacterized protein
MFFSKKFLLTALSAALLVSPSVVPAAEYVDVLDMPAAMSQLAIKNPLNAVTHAGDRLVTVGIRGHILYSDDTGKTWQQAKVPVSSDLTSVYFPTASDGWAVGHDGVVLHSSDGGQSWSKQLDGTQTGKIMLDHYTALAATDPANEQYATLVADAQRVADEGADKPFLDVWFADNQNGYVVGAFGMIFRTSDAGKSWVPLNEMVDNAQGYHLNAISGSGADVMLVSEMGLVLRLDPATGKFTPVQTPFDGTYFGLLHTGNGIVIYGLRGMAFSTADGGNSWRKLDVPVGKALTAATQDKDGELFLFDQAGDVLSSKDGASFQLRPQTSASPISGAAAVGSEALVLVGPRGVRVFPIE